MCKEHVRLSTHMLLGLLSSTSATVWACRVPSTCVSSALKKTASHTHVPVCYAHVHASPGSLQPCACLGWLPSCHSVLVLSELPRSIPLLPDSCAWVLL